MILPEMRKSAAISSCGRYRYHLSRVWDPARPRLIVCMLNPSNADAARDDPTVLVLIHFAMAWGYGGIEIVNLRAWRTSRPRDLFEAEHAGCDTAGPRNLDWWDNVRGYALTNNVPILVAWGNSAPPAAVKAFLAAMGPKIPLICLGRTASGAPIHPAARGRHRVPRDRQPIPFTSELQP